MIDIRYKKIFDEFVKKYEEIHVHPWHQISKDELMHIYENLVQSMDVVNLYRFKYFMDYIIKRLCGFEDAHTWFDVVDFIPMNFRKFDQEILINYPENLKGSVLVSINGIPIQQVLDEIEDVITYGTEGKRNYEIEKALFNRLTMFGLPSFRDSNELVYEIVDIHGHKLEKKFTKAEQYGDLFDYNYYRYGNIAEYKFLDHCLVYTQSSLQKNFRDVIENTVQRLMGEDLSQVDTIILDIRGNLGGNRSLNHSLVDFLKSQTDKQLICLTDYRIFSGGRYSLEDFISLGASTIGEEIGTPINCFGNSHWFFFDKYPFSISESYLYPTSGVSASSKEEFNQKITEEIRKPDIFHPDIEVKQTKEDYLKGIDTILNYAIEYSRNQRLKR